MARKRDWINRLSTKYLDSRRMINIEQVDPILNLVKKGPMKQRIWSFLQDLEMWSSSVGATVIRSPNFSPTVPLLNLPPKKTALHPSSLFLKSETVWRNPTVVINHLQLRICWATLPLSRSNYLCQARYHSAAKLHQSPSTVHNLSAAAARDVPKMIC